MIGEFPSYGYACGQSHFIERLLPDTQILAIDDLVIVVTCSKNSYTEGGEAHNLKDEVFEEKNVLSRFSIADTINSLIINEVVQKVQPRFLQGMKFTTARMGVRVGESGSQLMVPNKEWRISNLHDNSEKPKISRTFLTAISNKVDLVN
ncbi:hypothetical protein Tco_0336288 [Tanacetum coccineum]